MLPDSEDRVKLTSRWKVFCSSNCDIWRSSSMPTGLLPDSHLYWTWSAVYATEMCDNMI